MSENPTREKIQSDLVEVVRIGYDTLQKEEKKLGTAVNGLIEFFFKVNERDHSIPYQYRDVNQLEFYRHANIISASLSQVEPVLSDMKTRMFNLEKGNQVIKTESPNGQIQEQTVAKPEEKKPLISIPSFKHRKPAPSLPYQSTINMQKKMETLVEDWELVVHYQAYGVDLARDDFDGESAEDYLTYHRNMFCWNVAPSILRIFKQGSLLQLEKEKNHALQALTANMKESFSTRNDFPQPPR